MVGCGTSTPHVDGPTEMRPKSTSYAETDLSIRMNILESLLALSNDFSDYLEECIDSAETMVTGDRFEASAAAADLSFEHAFALRVAFDAGAPNSAAALLRMQYEALLRSAWLLYAATDAQLEKANATLTKESATSAKNIAGAEDMLKALERCLQEQPQLRGLIVPLRQIRDVSWAAMNGFVHGGLHPLARTREGFPEVLAASLVKMSNGMLHIAARILARLTGSAAVLKKVEQSHLKFANCLPIITPPGA
jgi:hypothetical protein